MNQTVTKDTDNNRHDGMQVKRVREMLKVKQSTLAHALGEDWNQKKISQLEDKEVIDDKLMEEIAGALKMPVEAIRNFDEEKTVMNIQNNYEGSNAGSNSGAFNNYHCTFNALDKLMEVTEENKRLYERLLLAEKEKNEILQRMLGERK